MTKVKNIDKDPQVFITGIGLLSGFGIGSNDSWRSVGQEKAVIAKKNDWEFGGLQDQLFGRCAAFEFQEYFKDMQAPFPWRYSQLAMMACKLAIEDAALMLDELDLSRVGLIINSDLGASKAAEEYAFKLYGKGPERVSPFEFTKSVANCVIGDVARYFKLTGASSFILGENSVSYGYDLLRNGKADIVICGCFDEVRDRTVSNYKERGMTAEKSSSDSMPGSVIEDLYGQCGKMVLGEASGFIVLETSAHALKRGAKIYAALAGEYSGCDSLCNEILWERASRDLAYVMERSLTLSGLEIADISFIMGASSMPWQLQTYEMPAIRAVWMDNPVMYTTIKVRLGETFASSQTISLAFAALSLYHRQIPGSGLRNAAMTCAMDGVTIAEKIMDLSDPDHPSRQHHCMVNSIQLGGNTSSIILSSYAA